jgi:nucleoside-diphosphate-sugar epimerase
VTGASGFVGRWALSALRARGHEVHAIGRRADGTPALPPFASVAHTPRADSDGVVWHAADLLQEAAVRGVLMDVCAERLLHLAWVTDHGAYWESPANAQWVEATKSLIAGFIAAGGSRVVCAGTCAEYDWSEPTLERTDCDEATTATVPRTLYGESKLAVTTWLTTRASFSWASGRVFFAYGEGEDPRRLVPSVIRALLRGERARTGPGALVRDFMHVADVGAAFAALVDSEARGTVNVGSGTGLTLAAVVAAAAEIVGRPDAVDIGALPGRPSEPSRLVASVRRLRETGFSPTIPLEAGLRRTVAWWRAIAADASPGARSHAC